MAASTVRAETSAKPFPRVCRTGRAAETYAVGDSPAALVLAIERPIDELEVTPRNRAHHALMTGYLMRDLSFLGVQ